jgi:hypothetical protein
MLDHDRNSTHLLGTPSNTTETRIPWEDLIASPLPPRLHVLHYMGTTETRIPWGDLIASPPPPRLHVLHYMGDIFFWDGGYKT